MNLIDSAVFVLVLSGQRLMLTRPIASNVLWLIANSLLAGVAAAGDKWILVAMYLVLSVSNMQLIAKEKWDKQRAAVRAVVPAE